MAARRALAGALVVLAVVLVVRPEVAPPGGPLVVAARDLSPGAPLGPTDLVVRTAAPEQVPAGAVTDPAPVVGRLLVGGMRAGEPLTDVRLLGRASAVAAAGVPDAAGVPLRLADPAVATLLGPGTRVDVVGAGTGGGGTVGAGTVGGGFAGAAPSAGARGGEGAGVAVLAAGAVVLGVLPSAERSATGPVVVVALPAPAAARVAAATLGQEVTVTVR